MLRYTYIACLVGFCNARYELQCLNSVEIHYYYYYYYYY